MKKIIIAATLVFSAIASQAASVNWVVNNIQSSPDTTISAGWLVQVYSAATTFSYEAAKDGTITALDSAMGYASGTIFKANDTFGNYSAGDTVGAYLVIFDAATVGDAKNYIVSDALTKTINASGSDLNLSFGNMGGTATSNMFLNSSWTAVPSESVPEPTSGLLLLLGVAGLALRRRRA